MRMINRRLPLLDAPLISTNLSVNSIHVKVGRNVLHSEKDVENSVRWEDVY